ncbi:MAG: helix-turn-helix transcriptional regulator [Clostridiales bacterium]|nr:helix-turn-helix transcriptional regulator [Clostridiales bacterium]
MASKKTIHTFRQNLTELLSEDSLTSMRNLSTSIGASDSYIRKILNDDASPSLDKVDDISEFFDIDSWELFYDEDSDDDDSLAIIEMIRRMPADMLPLVKRYLEYLIEKEND